MNDTTRRFLAEVLQRVPESRIVEVRLFPPIRQGGIESGVAVLAVSPDFAAVVDATSTGAQPEPAPPAGEASEVEVPIAGAEGVAAPVLGEGDDVTSVARSDIGGHTPVDVANEVFRDLEREAALELASEGLEAPVPTPAGERARTEEGEVDIVVAADLPGVAPGDEDAESLALGDILALPSPGSGTQPHGSDRARRRLAILCARYKLVFKGVDRGRWDLEIVHQADAPIETLDRVIAGVIRRSGDTAEPERYTQQSLRESLDAPVWAEST
jgi:hypothetical protein